MTSDLDTQLRASPGVYARSFGGEVVLLEFRRGEYFGLDAIGAEVWKLIEAGPTTIAAATDLIVSRYDVAREDALRDIAALVAEMRASALVETCP